MIAQISIKATSTDYYENHINIQFEDDTLVASVQLEVDSESSLRCSYNNFAGRGTGRYHWKYYFTNSSCKWDCQLVFGILVQFAYLADK